jgi:hypothetical protein
MCTAHLKLLGGRVARVQNFIREAHVTYMWSDYTENWGGNENPYNIKIKQLKEDSRRGICDMHAGG